MIHCFGNSLINDLASLTPLPFHYIQANNQIWLNFIDLFICGSRWAVTHASGGPGARGVLSPKGRGGVCPGQIPTALGVQAPPGGVRGSWFSWAVCGRGCKSHRTFEFVVAASRRACSIRAGGPPALFQLEINRLCRRESLWAYRDLSVALNPDCTS